MEENKIEIRIETPCKMPIYRHADRVVLKTTEGLLEILCNHGRMVFNLGVGPCRLYNDEQEEVLGLFHGLAHIKEDSLVVLALNSETESEIDADRAQSALDRAKKRQEGRDPELPLEKVDMKRLEMSMRRARVRLGIKGAR